MLLSIMDASVGGRPSFAHFDLPIGVDVFSSLSCVSNKFDGKCCCSRGSLFKDAEFKEAAFQSVRFKKIDAEELKLSSLSYCSRRFGVMDPGNTSLLLFGRWCKLIGGRSCDHVIRLLGVEHGDEKEESLLSIPPLEFKRGPVPRGKGDSIMLSHSNGWRRVCWFVLNASRGR